MSNRMDFQLLTLKEVMQLCRVGRTFLYEEIKGGRLRAVKIGTLTRIRALDLDAWVERQEVLTKSVKQTD